MKKKQAVGRCTSFRTNVGAVLAGDDGRILAFSRADKRNPTWQMVQGGVNSGEELSKAVRREIKEETGIWGNDLTFIAESSHWHAYEFPLQVQKEKKFRGQVQKWFLFRFSGVVSKIHLGKNGTHAEFDDWKWTTLSDLAKEVVTFKRHVYEALVIDFGSHLK